MVSRSALAADTFDDCGGQERHKNFVMAGDGVASGFVAARCGGGTADHILQRAIVLEEIEIGGGDRVERSAEIAGDADSFQKNLGEDDG